MNIGTDIDAGVDEPSFDDIAPDAPKEPQVPLDMPPATLCDMEHGVLVCPSCGNLDAAVRTVEDAEIARCPRCTCEFSIRVESVSRKVIRAVCEHNARRMRAIRASGFRS